MQIPSHHAIPPPFLSLKWYPIHKQPSLPAFFYIVLLSSSYLSSSWIGKVLKGLWWKAYTMQVNDFIYSAGNLIYGIIAIYHTTSSIDYATAHSCKCLYNHHKLMFDMIWDISLTFFEIPGWSYSEILHNESPHSTCNYVKCNDFYHKFTDFANHLE